MSSCHLKRLSLVLLSLLFCGWVSAQNIQKWKNYLRGPGMTLVTSNDHEEFYFGLAGDVPVPADYNGDGYADLAVFREGATDARWYIRYSPSSTETIYFGLPGDIPVPADFDGDGQCDIAVFRPDISKWLYRRSSDGTTQGLYFGLTGDIPVPADLDGDGLADPSVFRPSASPVKWLYLSSASNYTQTVTVYFGTAEDIPLPGNYGFDTDGIDDMAVYRPSIGKWFIRKSSDLQITGKYFGSGTDRPVPADFDGDGCLDLALFRDADGVHAKWLYLFSHDQYQSSGSCWYGLWTDTPVPADYDGDGGADIAVFRIVNGKGKWFIKLDLTH